MVLTFSLAIFLESARVKAIDIDSPMMQHIAKIKLNNEVPLEEQKNPVLDEPQKGKKNRAESLNVFLDGLCENCPWPMIHHDIRHTSLSQSIGPHDANLLWNFAGWPDFWASESSPVIGLDGVIYIGDLGHLHAIDREGREIWCFDTGWTDSTPAIANDGTIYIGAWDGNLYAINPDGTEKWHFTTEAGIWLNSSPVIAENGNIYFGGNDGYLYALSDQGSHGQEIWRFTTDGPIYASPAIGPDGTIYISSWDGHLYAVNPNGTEKWRFPEVGCAQISYYEILKDLQKPKSPGIIDPSPSVGIGGVIYWPADFSLYALHPDNGEVLWQLDEWAFSTPSIASDGTIYVGLFPKDLIAVNPADGSILWRFTTGNQVTSSPAIGADGVIYFGCWDHNFYAVNKNGNELWRFPTGWWVTSSPALYGGTIYFASGDDNLYAIGESPPEAPTPDIKANGSDTPIDITSSDNLSVTVELNAGSYDGDQADWWVVADTLFGWYHYDTGRGSWMPGFVVTYQGPLFDLTPPFEVLNITGLPPWTYTFYFGVDMIMNGSLDMDHIYYDNVEVNVE